MSCLLHSNCIEYDFCCCTLWCYFPSVFETNGLLWKCFGLIRIISSKFMPDKLDIFRREQWCCRKLIEESVTAVSYTHLDVYKRQLTYGLEVWTLNGDLETTLNAIEIAYLNQSTKVSRLKQCTNKEVRTSMGKKTHMVEQAERLKWFKHVLRMSEENNGQKRYFSGNLQDTLKI